MPIDDKTAEERLVRRRAIGRQLRRLFEPAADEPAPQVLEDLARKLDRQIEMRGAAVRSRSDPEDER